ncbi:glycosyltransferase [Bacteroides sp. An269]|nr:glycosyltransferase [Bacteroides sp. An269]OUO70367.1 hypothetical protein B5F71_16510 [Bacteroides sp. An269]
MSFPKISVIVPVYNVEQYLPRCIDSILSQTFTDFELLLIDDGSTDKSGMICDEYAKKDNRIRVFHKKNGGVSSARNVGLDNVTYASREGVNILNKYILFVDSDDYLCLQHLQNYNDNLNADIIWQGYRLFDQMSGVTISEKRAEAQFASNKKACVDLFCKLFKMKNFFGPTWSKLFRFDIIEQHHLRFADDICFREDELFTFQYCKYVETARVLPTVTYNYQETANSLMRRYVNPHMIYNVINKSYEATQQLPLTQNFKNIIEDYYTDSLVMCGWSLYSTKHLESRNSRMHFLKLILKRKRLRPAKILFRFAPLQNPTALDLYHLARYFIKRMMRK